MKIAICFYGLLGSKIGKGGVGEVLPPEECYHYYKKHIFEKNDVDIFIHSWSHEYKDQIEELYRPKLSIIEQQLPFPNSKKLTNPINNLYDIKSRCVRIIKEILDPKLKELRELNAYRACSRWYSNKKVLELKKEYEERNGFEYDMVMVTRFDVSFYSDIVFHEYDNSCFWASNWNDFPRAENNFKLNYKNNHKDKGFLDLWFFSSSKNMDIFALLYDNMSKYPISPHFASRSHVGTFMNNEQIKYTLFRWQDYEMTRLKVYKSMIPHGGISGTTVFEMSRTRIINSIRQISILFKKK